jgi:hypothetical protein
MAKAKEPVKQELKVNTATVIGSVYSQVVGISVTDSEATLEFAYINPQLKGEAVVVARVSLPKIALERLAKLIPGVVKQHEENVKKRASQDN